MSELKLIEGAKRLILVHLPDLSSIEIQTLAGCLSNYVGKKKSLVVLLRNKVVCLYRKEDLVSGSLILTLLKKEGFKVKKSGKKKL